MLFRSCSKSFVQCLFSSVVFFSRHRHSRHRHHLFVITIIIIVHVLCDNKKPHHHIHVHLIKHDTTWNDIERRTLKRNPRRKPIPRPGTLSRFRTSNLRSDGSHLCSAADYRSSVTCIRQVWQELPHRNGKARLIEYQKRSLHARCILSQHVIIPSLPSSASHTNPTIMLQSRLSLPLPSICQLGNRGDGKGTKAPFITLTAYAWDSVLPGKG